MAQGSIGNVVASILNIPFPGLGQLVQGRFLAAFLFFIFTYGLYATIFFGIPLGFIGLIVHIWAIVDAARFKA